jgi:hypothetical protein
MEDWLMDALENGIYHQSEPRNTCVYNIGILRGK